MAIKFKKQIEPDTDSERSQIYEDSSDGHPKIKDSSGNVYDLRQIVEGSSFGNNYKFALLDNPISTTSTSWKNVIKFETDVLVDGFYNIAFTYTWRYSAGNRDFQARVLIDDSLEVILHREEPKDSGSDQRFLRSGNLPIHLGDGIHTLQIQYRTSSTSDTANIYYANMQIWRTS